VGQSGPLWPTALQPAVILTKPDLEALLQARHVSPHSVLGMHPCTQRRTRGLAVRALLRDAASCDVVLTGETPPAVFPMTLLAPEGLFEVFIPKRTEVCAYELRATSASGRVRQFHDPYCFLPTLGDQDLYLFNEGNEHRIYDKLGAHLRDLGGVPGTAFAVWAPSAARVSVVGDFNGWDGRYHPMRSLGASGVWEVFIPGIPEGSL
jgi:1,4-alpha-glucan branching enzyme